MAFNIKNEHTHLLAKEVSSLTGESMAEAVDTALRQRRAVLGGEEKRARTMFLLDLARKHADREFTSEDIGDLLYDEDGLPR